ncbi:sigma-70 family RNA polymerase sigma factor [Ancylobacter sp.]|uniref:sigma-70 family RNA polymerase sigma factor n=1 Tax=Ancylobacter sp. TaxID=1872567 RepID=UPI003D0A416A
MDGLFREYHRELATFAYRKLRDREAASDLVQDAFVRYIAHVRQTGTVAETPRFFLWRIASNLVLDIARRERRRGQMVALDAVSPHELADIAPSPERRLSARQEYGALRRALDELPTNARTALLLNRVEQMTHAQIAVRLGVSSSMVNKYISRALTHCVVRLSEAGF